MMNFSVKNPVKKTLPVLPLMVVCIFGGISVSHADTTLYRSLKLGMSGPDVQQLQIILNADPVTRISDHGIGSPGQESQYFGAKTRAAVVRFQEKYADKVLIPNGLYSGTGYVGPATLFVLNSLKKDVAATIPSFYTPISSVGNTQTNTTNNPNAKNLDQFVSDIEKLGKTQGMNADYLNTLKAQVRSDALSTTTNLNDAFTEMVKPYVVTSSSSNPPSSFIDKHSGFARLFDTIISAIKGSVKPKQAYAAFDTPFGGQRYYSFFCTCSANWLLGIQPLPPSYVTLLTYRTGTQLYQSYNVPISTYLLGKYSQGGQCQVYVGTGCATLPSWGEITPTVGSSPI